MLRLQPVHPQTIGAVQTPILVGPSWPTARVIGRYLAPLPRPLGDTLIFVTGSGTVTAAVALGVGQPTIRFLSCPDVDKVYRRALELEQTILHLDAAPADVNAPPERGRCCVCGCTMERACPSGCWWADDTETLCRQHGT
jgi:hypothetical protein